MREMNQVSLPIASSMTLIWFSEGERIFGGLSVRGAVERQTQRWAHSNLIYLVPLFPQSGLKSGLRIELDKWLWPGNYSFKALNTSAHSFNAAASLIIVAFFLYNHVCSNNMVWAQTALRYWIYGSCVTTQPFLSLQCTLRWKSFAAAA